MTALTNQARLAAVGEIGVALAAARDALDLYAADPQRVEPLSDCVEHVREVLGVLRVLQIAGGSLLADEMHRVLSQASTSGSANLLERTALDAVMRGLVRLPEYLRRDQSGLRQNLLELLPLVNDLRRLRREPMLSESELLTTSVPSASVPARADHEQLRDETAALVRRMRPRFQVALVGLARGERTTQHLRTLTELSGALEKCVSDPKLSQLWWVVSALLESLSLGSLDVTPVITRLLGQVDAELKRLAEEGEAMCSATPPGDLLTDLLAQISRAHSAGPIALAVRAAFESKGARSSMESSAVGAQDAPLATDRLLASVTASLLADLSSVKEALDTHARFGRASSHALQPQLQLLGKIGDTLGELGCEDLRDLVLQECARLTAVASGTGGDRDARLLGIAATMLDLEQRIGVALSSAVNQLPEPAPPSQQTGDIREAQAALYRECLVELSKAKALVDATMHRGVGDLAGIDAGLSAIIAALTVVGDDRAAIVVRRLQRTAAGLVALEGRLSPPIADQWADVIVALELYLDDRQARRPADDVLDIAATSVGVLSDSVTSALALSQSAALAASPESGASVASSSAGGESSAAVADIIDDVDIVEVFRAEAADIARSLEGDIGQWLTQPTDREVLARLRRGFHTLKGSGRMVGAYALGEFSWAVERLLNRLLESTRPASAAVLDAVAQAVALLPSFMARLGDREQQVAESDYLERRLEALASGQNIDVWPDTVTDEAPSSTSIGQDANEPVALGSDHEHPGSSPPDQVLASIYQNEMRVHLDMIDAWLEAHAQASGPLIVTDSLHRSCHTAAGAARTAGSAEAADLAESLSRWIHTLREQSLPMPRQALKLGRGVVTALRSMVLSDVSPEATTSVEDLLARLSIYQSLLDRPQCPVVGTAIGPASSGSTAVSDSEDSADGDIRLVFGEEAAELLEAGEKALVALAQPSGGVSAVVELQRVLHTLKGGARMAGVRAMSDLAHDMESLLVRVEGAGGLGDAGFRSLLQACFDDLHRMREALRDGRDVTLRHELEEAILSFRLPSAVAAEDELPVAAMASGQGDVEVPTPTSADGVVREERRDLARVDAALLNQLLNGAGEVSICRSRLEQQMSSVEFNLSELTRVIQRMKAQLRKLEFESEARIQHRGSEVKPGEGFDPLELDRFTGLQHTTRALSESAADIASLQSLLEGQIREGQSLLIQQARTITELQNGLMRARMVPFERYVPRLARTLRQVALETGRQAELVVTGADGELDRQVLERLLPPFEHMVRNAIVHGIETPEERLRRGKPEIGRVEVSLRREGAATFIVISDDGSGMDLRAIREKAIAGGFIDPRQSLSDQEAMQLTLEPGFSTASSITAAAGRGVGMDVVVTEIKRLGGELHIATSAGVGTSFTVRLPFTLAVSHALIVRANDELYALPLPTIEAVVRVARDDVSKYLAEGVASFTRDGQSYRFQYLGSFIGAGPVDLSAHEPIVNVVLIRAGAHSTAVIADELIGNREIVVKNVGPQVGTVRGISGATVLGDGRVVLILDMPTLVRSEARLRTPPELLDDRIDRRPLVLVVDDSITVRRVTQRLLERHGMRVMLAKDGVEARKLLETQTPDVMLLDIEMPRMDGYEVAAQVRTIERLKQMPIVMITSRVGDKHRARAIELGVNDYLSKPYQEHQLLDAIEPFLVRHRETS